MSASINLVPNACQARQRRARRRRAWANNVGGLAALLGAAWIAEGMWPDQIGPLRAHATELRTRHSEARLELARAVVERDGALEAAQRVLSMQARAAWSEALMSVSAALPPGVLLTVCDGAWSGAATGAPEWSLTLRGYALGHGELADFTEALRETRTFQRIEPGTITRAPHGGSEALSFELTLWASEGGAP